jgi:hypothetical protein
MKLRVFWDVLLCSWLDVDGSTSQKTELPKIKWLMVFKEIIAVYSENHTKPMNTKYRVKTYRLTRQLGYRGLITFSVNTHEISVNFSRSSYADMEAWIWPQVSTVFETTCVGVEVFYLKVLPRYRLAVIVECTSIPSFLNRPPSRVC